MAQIDFPFLNFMFSHDEIRMAVSFAFDCISPGGTMPCWMGNGTF